MATFISENTDKPTPIICRFCDTERGARVYPKSTAIAAIRLRGQWEGGDQDVNPHWVPVCWEHDTLWDDVDVQQIAWGERLDPKYQLPAFDLENWWVVIDRDGSPDLGKPMVIGPYPSEEDAALARDESMLVQAELEDPGGTDCFIQPWKGRQINQDLFDVVLITLDDPTYTGKGD